MHHPPTWYLFMVALFLLWAWGFADAIHTLRHRAKHSFWKLFVAVWLAIGDALMMLLMIIGAVLLVVHGEL